LPKWQRHRSALKEQQAAALARQAGVAKLALCSGEHESKADAWGPVKSVSRLDRQQLPAAALQAIFRANVETICQPMSVPKSLTGPTLLYKIIKVGQPAVSMKQRRDALKREYSTILGQEDFAAYLAGLRSRYKIDINQSALDSKER
jgi:peptidyl-prolyl cis-trans isomerase D